jgi:cell division protein FtsB
MDKKEVFNWISTVIAILLGLSAIVGWFQTSGRSRANSANIALQTQKQWELRQADQVIIAQLRQDIATIRTDIKWLEKGHKTVDMEVK